MLKLSSHGSLIKEEENVGVALAEHGQVCRGDGKEERIRGPGRVLKDFPKLRFRAWMSKLAAFSHSSDGASWTQRL